MNKIAIEYLFSNKEDEQQIAKEILKPGRLKPTKLANQMLKFAIHNKFWEFISKDLLTALITSNLMNWSMFKEEEFHRNNFAKDTIQLIMNNWDPEQD